MTRLSERQGRILRLMRDNFGRAVFFGRTRKFRHWQAPDGVVIAAYQSPEMFLERRGLIERIPWFTIYEGPVRLMRYDSSTPLAVGRAAMTHRLTEAGKAVVG